MPHTLIFWSLPGPSELYIRAHDVVLGLADCQPDPAQARTIHKFGKDDSGEDVGRTYIQSNGLDNVSTELDSSINYVIQSMLGFNAEQFLRFVSDLKTMAGHEKIIRNLTVKICQRLVKDARRKKPLSPISKVFQELSRDLAQQLAQKWTHYKKYPCSINFSLPWEGRFVGWNHPCDGLIAAAQKVLNEAAVSVDKNPPYPQKGCLPPIDEISLKAVLESGDSLGKIIEGRDQFAWRIHDAQNIR